METLGIFLELYLKLAATPLHSSEGKCRDLLPVLNGSYVHRVLKEELVHHAQNNRGV